MSEREDGILRKARDADVPALARLWAQAFPGGRSSEDRERILREGGSYGGLEETWVGTQDGRMAGALRTYSLAIHVWGRTYECMGLGAVAVAPDFRRRGIGTRMCIEALRIARDRGDVLSILYPFRVSYYRRLGYTLAGELHRFEFSPRDLRDFSGGDHVQWVATEAEAEIRAVYNRVAARSNGLIVRPDRAWAFLRDPDLLVFVQRPPGGEARGYLVARARETPRGPELQVKELLAETHEAYEGLLGWLGDQGDQWSSVIYEALPSEDFERHLGHPRRPGEDRREGLWFEAAGLLRGPMVRILNLKRVLADVGLSQVSGLRVLDEQLPENSGVWEGGASPERTEEGEKGEPGEEHLEGLSGGVPSLSIRGVSDLFVRGMLGSRAPHPDGWEPALGLTDFRLLDEF